MLVETLGILSILVIFKTYGYRNILIGNHTAELDAEIVNQISILLTLETGVILVIQSFGDYENKYVNHFLKSSDYPLQVGYKPKGWTLVKAESADNFIIVTGLDTLGKDIGNYVTKRGFYFFILRENETLDYNETWPIFQSVWKIQRTIHVYILTSSDGVITFDPFTYDYTRSEYGSVLPLGQRKSVEDLFKNLNGYPINIEIFRSVYSYPMSGSDGQLTSVTGADAEVAYELGRLMNFIILFQQPDKDNFGHLTANGTFNGALGRAISAQVDMTITGYFIKDYFTRDVEFTVAVYSDQLCCYVPKADRVPQSILPLFSFSTTMWMCYFATAMACGSIWSAIRCFNLVLFKQNVVNCTGRWKCYQFMQIFIDTWIVWVRVALRKFPSFGSEKLFLVSVCLLSVIFGAIFESSLATVYIKPLYYKDITTLRELDTSGFRILYKYASMGDDAFAKGSSDLFTRLANKMQFVTFKESVMETMVRKGGFASITRKSSISLENVQHFAGNKLFMIPECPKTYTLAYILPKNSPLAESVNMWLLRFLRAGLIDKWIDRMYFEATLDDMKRNKKDAADGAKVLTMADLQLPFIIIASGSMLGFIVVFGEIYLTRRRLRRQSLDNN